MSVNVPPGDRFLIHDVFARYSRAEDTDDAAAYAALFTPEGTDDAAAYAALFTPEGVCAMRDNVYHGRQAIEDFMSPRKFKGFRHHTTQILFEEGDDKRCRVSSYSTIWFVNKDRTSELRQHGIYRDILVKLDDGQWDTVNPEKYRPVPR